MSSQPIASVSDHPDPCALAPGVILVSPHGQVKIIRSRTRDDSGWNCADGAAIDDASAGDPDQWRAYEPEQLASDLVLAEDVRQLAGHRVLGGGIATWDACSGRPCILPKLAKIVQGASQGGRAVSWISAD